MVDEHEIHRFEGEGGKVVELHGTWSPEDGFRGLRERFDRLRNGIRPADAATCVKLFQRDFDHMEDANRERRYEAWDPSI